MSEVINDTPSKWGTIETVHTHRFPRNLFEYLRHIHDGKVNGGTTISVEEVLTFRVDKGRCTITNIRLTSPFPDDTSLAYRQRVAPSLVLRHAEIADRLATEFHSIPPIPMPVEVLSAAEPVLRP